jgi:Putative peptidoglycan binding domain
MSDLVLLVTDLLTKRQIYPSILLNPPAQQLDKNVQKSIQSQSYELVSSSGITQPEFIQPDVKFPTTSSKFQPDMMRMTKKVRSQRLSFSHQIKSSSVIKAEFTNKQQLLAQQISENIVIIRSRRFSNQNLPNLRFGHSGLAVRVLQRLLVANGYAVRVDGGFGALTESAVKAFQNQQRLNVDGVVGQRTWRQLAR